MNIWNSLQLSGRCSSEANVWLLLLFADPLLVGPAEDCPQADG